MNGGNTWTSGYNLEFTQHLILEFDGYDNNVVSDFHVGETISSKLIDASSTSNINYQWQKSQDNNIWSDIQNENSDELIISSDLVGQNLRLSISYDLNGQSYTSFSEASPTISFPGEIPHVQGGNATIIQLGASEIPGVDAGIYHLYSSEWSKDHNNLSIHETPNFE